MIHEGHMTISRVGGDAAAHSRSIRIMLRAPGLGRKAVTVEVTPEDFALALTGLSEVPVGIDVRIKAIPEGSEVPADG
jgi:hypothetical protein